MCSANCRPIFGVGAHVFEMVRKISRQETPNSVGGVGGECSIILLMLMMMMMIDDGDDDGVQAVQDVDGDDIVVVVDDEN